MCHEHIIVRTLSDQSPISVKQIIFFQVIALLRRVLPEVAPRTMATLLSVPNLPSKEFSILAPSSQNSSYFDLDTPGILDVFLACIAKALNIQTKVKGYGSGKTMSSFVLNDCLHSQ